MTAGVLTPEEIGRRREMALDMKPLDAVNVLLKLVADLESENAWLRSFADGNYTVRLSEIYGLKELEAFTLALLYSAGGKYRSFQYLKRIVYGGRPRGDNGVRQIICFLRKKMGPAGIVIETRSNVGYRLDPPSVARIREALS